MIVANEGERVCGIERLFLTAVPLLAHRRCAALPLPLHLLAACAHQKIACFLTQKRNAFFTFSYLIVGRIKFFRWSFGRRNCPLVIPFPQDRAQTSDIST